MDRGDRMADRYEAHAPAAYRLAFLLVGDREIAADLVQDAFVRLISRFGHLRSPDRFEQYLRRTVTNLAMSYFRRRSVERRFLAVARHQRSPGVAFPDVETQDALWLDLQHLPSRQRAALVLRYYEDLSEEQTGAALGISERAVNALVSRALQQLRESRGERDEVGG